MHRMLTAATAHIPGPATRVSMTPLTFTPHLRAQVWGGRRLETVVRKPLPPSGHYGESWEISTQPLHVSQAASGPWAGRSLKEIWEQVSELWQPVGQRADGAFPLLVKWLDCDAMLSVQVHPGDECARRLLNQASGKTEAWVVVHAEPTARIYAGLKPGVDRAEVERRSADGTIAECLHSFTPVRGDVIHVPAGTVHASGGGIVMAEVQQTSDATFRLFDWNRLGADGKPRQLHLAEALECIDWKRGPVDPVARIELDGPRESSITTVNVCPYFRFESLAVGRDWISLSGDDMTIVMSLAGSLTIGDGEDALTLEAGATCLLPPNPMGWMASTDEGQYGRALVVRVGRG
jgi:mannose-6-phosphate isomerase